MIEHTPDFVTHLLDIHSLLNDGGVYLFILPDKRATFDFFIQESSLPEIITAYLLKRTRPSLRSVIEHRAFTAYNYKAGVNPILQPSQDLWLRILGAKREFEENIYVDVHCWYFTPESLLQIINGLILLGIIPSKTIIKTFQFGAEIGGMLEFNM